MFLSKPDCESGVSFGDMNSTVVEISSIPAVPVFFYQTLDHLTTLQACSFVCTTLCTVFGPLKQQKGAQQSQKSSMIKWTLIHSVQIDLVLIPGEKCHLRCKK
jgi:hypothetical protein